MAGEDSATDVHLVSKQKRKRPERQLARKVFNVSFKQNDGQSK